MAISSTGLNSPQGRLQAAVPLTRRETWDQGRLAAAPRFRERQASATRAWPLATARAAWPTVAHPAPPP